MAKTLATAKVRAYINGSTVYLMVQGMPYTEDGKTKYGRVRVSTGISLGNLNDWDDGREMVKTKVQGSDRLNAELERYRAIMQRAYGTALGEENLHPERVRELYERYVDEQVRRDAAPVIVTRSKAPVDYREMPFESKPIKPLPKIKGQFLFTDLIREVEDLTPNVKVRNQIASFRNKVERYQPSITVDRLTDEWRNGFFDHLRNELKLAENTCWGQQKWMNKVLNYATKDRPVRLDLKISSKHKFSLSPADRDFLDWNEIRQVYEHEVTADREDTRQRLEDGKTLLLTYCLTSIRISDTWSFFEGLKDRGNGMMSSEFRVSKPPHPVVVPFAFLPLQQQIKKAGIPKHRSEKDIRIAIKDLIEQVGIGKTIKPHSGRNSFITNTMIAMPHINEVHLCRAFTGHATSSAGAGKVFRTYDKAQALQSQQILFEEFKKLPKERTGGMRLL